MKEKIEQARKKLEEQEGTTVTGAGELVDQLAQNRVFLGFQDRKCDEMKESLQIERRADFNDMSVVECTESHHNEQEFDAKFGAIVFPGRGLAMRMDEKDAKKIIDMKEKEDY